MSKVKRYFLILPILCIALIPCTSVFVSAAGEVFKFSIPEPPVDSYHGYFLLPYYNPTLNKSYANLFFWVITPVNTDTNTSAPSVTFEYDEQYNDIYFMISTGQTDVSYAVTVYSLSAYSHNLNSQCYIEAFDVVSYDSVCRFSATYGNDIKFYDPVYMGVSSLGFDEIPSSYGSYSVLWSDDTAFYDELISASSKLTDLINGLDLTNEQLEETYSLLSDYLKKIYQNTDSMTAILDQLYYDFYYWTWTVDEHHERIIQLLEQLIEGTEEYTESSTLSDEQNELNRVEDELLNNEAASDAQNDIKVEINENAMSYIWDLITSFLSSNPKVFGLFISILSLGIIALVLNR